MIFPLEHIRLIANGRKTQTRRSVKRHETGCRYVKERHYAVQEYAGDKERDDLRIEIVETRREPLGAISAADVNAEGFRSREAFFAFWKTLERKGVDQDPGHDVWVITFKIADVDRFLARKSELGYTFNRYQALDGEPPVLVNAGDLEDFASEGRKRHSAAHPERRQGLREGDVEKALWERLRSQHRGKSPEQVASDDPQQGRPVDVRLRRRQLGLDEDRGVPKAA